MDEETVIYLIIDKVISSGFTTSNAVTKAADKVTRKSLESEGMPESGVPPAECAEIIESFILPGGLLTESQNGVLEITSKGRFFWKRVRRNRQGFGVGSPGRE